MVTEKINSIEFKQTIKSIIKENPKASPVGRVIGNKLSEIGFLTLKELKEADLKPGRCSKYEIKVGRGVRTYTNIKKAS